MMEWIAKKSEMVQMSGETFQDDGGGLWRNPKMMQMSGEAFQDGEGLV